MNYMLMPLRRYADFQGRSRRSEFWMFALMQILIVCAFLVILMAAGGAIFMSGGDFSQVFAAGSILIVIFLFFGLFWLATIIPYYAVSVRRLHDTGRTGWWAFAPLLLSIVTNVFSVSVAASGDASLMAIPVLILSLANFALSIAVLVFLCLDGTPGPNQYGQDPKQRGYDQTFA